MLPVDILDKIFYYTNAKNILYFEDYIYPSTIKKLIKTVNINRLVKFGCVRLIKHYIAYHKCDWNELSRIHNLPEVIIINFSNQLNWRILSHWQNLSDSIIERYINKIDFCFISIKGNLTDTFITKYVKYLDWNMLCGSQTVSYNIIQKFPCYISFDIISGYDSLDDDFIIEFSHLINWKILQENYIISECIIHMFPEKIDFAKVNSGFNVSDMIINAICNNIYYWTDVHEYIEDYEHFVYNCIDNIVYDFINRKNWELNGGLEDINDGIIYILLDNIYNAIDYIIIPIAEELSHEDLYINIDVDEVRDALYNVDWSIILQ
jgi:hypothetical protein